MDAQSKICVHNLVEKIQWKVAATSVKGAGYNLSPFSPAPSVQ